MAKCRPDLLEHNAAELVAKGASATEDARTMLTYAQRLKADCEAAIALLLKFLGDRT